MLSGETVSCAADKGPAARPLRGRVNRHGLFVLVIVAMLHACASAQTPVSPVPMEGKVPGVAATLLDVYREFRDHVDGGGDARSFRPAQAGVTVIAGRIIVDASAIDDAAELKRELELVDCTQAATAGNTVSCHLPIASIPELQGLRSLRFVRPAQPMTRR